MTSEFNDELSLNANLKIEREEFEKQSVLSESD